MIKVANFVIDEKFIDWQIEFQDMTKDMCQHDYYYVGNKAFKFIKNKNGRVKQIKNISYSYYIIQPPPYKGGGCNLGTSF